MEEEKRQIAEQQALVIEAIKVHLQLLDTEFMKKAAEDMRNKASLQESASVIYPAYNHNTTKLIRVQADALDYIISFKEALIEAQELKDRIVIDNKQAEEISKIFN